MKNISLFEREKSREESKKPPKCLIQFQGKQTKQKIFKEKIFKKKLRAGGLDLLKRSLDTHSDV